MACAGCLELRALNEQQRLTIGDQREVIGELRERLAAIERKGAELASKGEYHRWESS